MPVHVVRNPGKTKGYFEEQGPEGTVRGETFTCPHCNDVRDINRTRQVHMCEHCWAPICEKPACRNCVPFEKKLERMEKAAAVAASRRSLFKAAGIE